MPIINFLFIMTRVLLDAGFEPLPIEYKTILVKVHRKSQLKKISLARRVQDYKINTIKPLPAINVMIASSLVA